MDIDDAVKRTLPPHTPAAFPNGTCLVVQTRIPKIDQDSVRIAFWQQGERAVDTNVLMSPLYDVVQAIPVPDDTIYGDYVEFLSIYSCWGFEFDKIAIPGRI
jgi:hypothetical protein